MNGTPTKMRTYCHQKSQKVPLEESGGNAKNATTNGKQSSTTAASQRIRVDAPNVGTKEEKVCPDNERQKKTHEAPTPQRSFPSAHDWFTLLLTPGYGYQENRLP